MDGFSTGANSGQLVLQATAYFGMAIAMLFFLHPLVVGFRRDRRARHLRIQRTRLQAVRRARSHLALVPPVRLRQSRFRSPDLAHQTQVDGPVDVPATPEEFDPSSTALSVLMEQAVRR